MFFVKLLSQLINFNRKLAIFANVEIKLLLELLNLGSDLPNVVFELNFILVVSHRKLSLQLDPKVVELLFANLVHFVCQGCDFALVPILLFFPLCSLFLEVGDLMGLYDLPHPSRNRTIRSAFVNPLLSPPF